MNRILLFIVMTLPLISEAQGFRRRLYLPGVDQHLSKAIYEQSDGSFLAAGLVVESVNNVQTNRLCIMGLDPQGQLLWTKKHGNSKFEYLNNTFLSRMFYKQNNNLYFVGCARDSNNVFVGVLIKFDVNGDTIWRKIYRDPNPQKDVIPQMMTTSVDGGFLITGFFQTNDANPSNTLMLIKSDANGNELWRQNHGKVFPNAQDGRAILQDPSSKAIVIVGYQYIGTSQTWWPYDNVVLLDSLGAFKNRGTYAGFGGLLTDMIQTSDQKFVAVGQKMFPNMIGGTNLTKSFVMKFSVDVQSNSIQPIWKLDGFGPMLLTNFFCSLRELQDGSLIVGGIIDTLQSQNIAIENMTSLVRLDQNGNVIQSRFYNYKGTLAENQQIIRGLEATSDGGIIAAIECLNVGTVNPMFFVKYDSSGCDSTIQYCQELLASDISLQTANSPHVRCYPNPMGDRLNVEIPEHNSSDTAAEFQLSDTQGRLILRQTLLFSRSSIDLRWIPQGVYLGSVRHEGKTLYNKKLVK